MNLLNRERASSTKACPSIRWKTRSLKRAGRPGFQVLGLTTPRKFNHRNPAPEKMGELVDENLVHRKINDLH